MSDGRVTFPAPTGVPAETLWTHLFRCFTIALDPRKLLAAAVGLLIVSLGWYVLSCVFYYAKPTKNDEAYKPEAVKRALGTAKKANGEDYTEGDIATKSNELLAADVARWTVINDLAGDRGKLSTLPWNEFRGENPFLFATELAAQPAATYVGSLGSYLVKQVPVLAEPLLKLLIPVVRMIDPNASFGTRVYLLLCLAWGVAIWAFFAGIITRLAAVQLGGKERCTLVQAVKFVTTRYLSYVLSPIIPFGAIAFAVVALFVYGLLGLIPIVGDLVFYGLLFPVVLLGGIAMAIILLGLAGYPLMYATISTEGSDTFDGISRSYNYVFMAPWSYLWYSLLALLQGAAVTFVVILLGCLMVVMGKWAISSAAGVTTLESRRPDYLFVYAPESLGWKELLLKGSPAAVTADPKTLLLVDVNPASAEEYRKALTLPNKIAAGFASFWLIALLMLLIGFSYSFFWSAYTVVYLLLRRKLDGIEMDEVNTEDLTTPLTPAPTPTPEPSPTPLTPAGGMSLPMVMGDTPTPSPTPLPTPTPTPTPPTPPAVVPPVVVPPPTPPPQPPVDVLLSIPPTPPDETPPPTPPSVSN